MEWIPVSVPSRGEEGSRKYFPKVTHINISQHPPTPQHEPVARCNSSNSSHSSLSVIICVIIHPFIHFVKEVDAVTELEI